MTLTIVFVVKIICQIIETLYSAKYLSKIVNFDIKPFIKNSVLSCLFMLIGIALPLSVTPFIETGSILSAITNTIIGETIFMLSVWKLGLTKPQRNKIKLYVKNKTGINF